jgi:hypothetical protein
LNDIRESLRDQGWRDESYDGGATDRPPHVRMERGEDIVQAFYTAAQGMQAAGPDFEPAVIVDYRDRFSRDEMRALLEPLLEDAPSTDLLATFRELFRRTGLQDAWGAAIENRPPDSVQAAVALSEWYESQERMDEARFAMKQALALNDVAGHGHRRDFDEDETFGLCEREERYFTPEVLDSLGAVSLDDVEFPLELDVRLGAPLIFYYTTPEIDYPAAWAYTFTKGEAEGFFVMRKVQVHPGLSTGSMGGMPLPITHPIIVNGRQDMRPLMGTFDRGDDGALKFTVDTL